MIIGLLNQKSGVGKTTLAVNIGSNLARTGARVLLIDADPQGSALDWATARNSDPLFPVIGLPRATLHREMNALVNDYEHVLIDDPPRVADITRSATKQREKASKGTPALDVSSLWRVRRRAAAATPRASVVSPVPSIGASTSRSEHGPPS